LAAPEIDVHDAQDRIEQGAFILDVRELDEWTAGHAAGATFIPLGELVQRIDELPRDKPIIAVCRSGARSGRATEYLVNAGYDAVNMAGGMKAWERAGYEVTTDSAAPGQVI
jgi:rhodanese-related sulfurtransferase